MKPVLGGWAPVLGKHTVKGFCFGGGGQPASAVSIDADLFFYPEKRLAGRWLLREQGTGRCTVSVSLPVRRTRPAGRRERGPCLWRH